MQKPGHIKPDCPFLKKSLKKGDQKKKAMITIWDDLESSSSKKKEQVANICLMAYSENEHVSNSESTMVFSNYKELEQAFDNLLNGSHSLTQKCIFLKEQLSDAQKENEKLRINN